jgi:ATP-binding cassette, subfamily B, bacterial MsbA
MVTTGRRRRGRVVDRAGDMTPGEALHQARRLLALVRPYRLKLAVALASVAVSSALTLVFPLVVGDLVDNAFGRIASGATTSLNRIALLLLAIFAVQAVFNYWRIFYLGVVGEGVVADLRTRLYEHLMGLTVRFFESRKTGEITSRLTSDVAVVQSAVSQALAQLLSQGLMLGGGVVFLFVISVRLSLLTLTVVPVIILAAAFFGRRLQRVSTEFQDRVADANASAEESIAGVRVVQWFTAEGAQIARYSAQVTESFRVSVRRARLRALFVPAVTFAMFGAVALVLWAGGRMVLAGTITGGTLVSFLLYTFTVAGAIGTFTGLYGQFQEALGSSRRIFELLDEVSDLPEPDDPIPLDRVEGRITFAAVSFSYGDRDRTVLDRIDLEARPGEVIALVGPSGAGKSTLVSLVPRFYDPTAGSVRLDGHDLRTLGLHDLRRQMAAVPQETQLFSGTISENIRFARPGASDAEVVSVAQAANAHDFITAFPAGYETIVGERGVKLSGGQRQRIAIARALLKDPRILILDEATSALDAESEAQVQEALEHLMEGRTTFVIAHRLSTVRHADRILVMHEGRIVQEGTHDRLLAAGGLYADLYEHQLIRADGAES